MFIQSLLSRSIYLLYSADPQVVVEVVVVAVVSGAPKVN